jgi:hypothetical protein
MNVTVCAYAQQGSYQQAVTPAAVQQYDTHVSHTAAVITWHHVDQLPFGSSACML